MKNFSPVLATLVVSAFLLANDQASAQMQVPVPAAGGMDRPLVIKKIDGGKIKTPEYQVRPNPPAQRSRDWYKVEVIYDTDPEWLDEVSFTYFMVVKAKQPQPGRPAYTLFKGEVTYINVEKGRHKSDIYLHPSTLMRLGDVERVAVQVSVGGRMVAMDGLPAGSVSTRWWEQLAPQQGYLLNRLQTPFAMISFDDYEAIKPKP